MLPRGGRPPLGEGTRAPKGSTGEGMRPTEGEGARPPTADLPEWGRLPAEEGAEEATFWPNCRAGGAGARP